MVDMITVDDSKSSIFGKPLLWAGILIFVQVTLIATLVPNSYVYKYIVRENQLVYEKVGLTTYTNARTFSKAWYNKLFVESGFEQSVYFFFIPSQEQYNRSGTFKGLGDDSWFPWIMERGAVLRSITHQMIQRMYLTGIWVPMLMLLAVPAFLDGVFAWKIRQYTFDYPSPIAHRYAVQIIAILFVVTILALMVPYPLNPIFFPLIWMFVIPMTLMMIVSNMPKKL